MADFVIQENQQPNYIEELKSIINSISQRRYKDRKRSSLFFAQKAFHLSNRKKFIEDKFQKIAGIFIDKDLEPEFLAKPEGKNFTIKLNNGVNISSTEKSFISGKPAPYISKGNEDVLIFDNFICNNLNIIGTDKEDKILIRNSTGLNIDTKDADDSILVTNGYFININAGKGYNNIKCDNVSRTTINLEKSSQNSIEVVNNYPNTNNVIKFPSSELKKTINLNNETENLDLKVEE